MRLGRAGEPFGLCVSKHHAPRSQAAHKNEGPALAIYEWSRVSRAPKSNGDGTLGSPDRHTRS